MLIIKMDLSSHVSCGESQIREFWSWTATWDISLFIFQFIRELLAYIKNFCELCIQVVHTIDLKLIVLCATKLLKINDMCHFSNTNIKKNLIPPTGVY